MKIYTIANKVSECYGHGSFGDELRICRQGSYGSGEFPPAFKTREAALQHLSTLKYNHDKVVVELELKDSILVELHRSLSELLEVHRDTPCRLDHHGNCQAHYLDSSEHGCRVARAREVLKEASR